MTPPFLRMLISYPTYSPILSLSKSFSQRLPRNLFTAAAYKIIESINAIDRSIDYLVAVAFLVVVVVVVVCEDDQIKKSQRDLVQKEKKERKVSRKCASERK